MYTGVIIDKQTQQCLVFGPLPQSLDHSSSVNFSLTNMPNALSAHQSHSEADDWPHWASLHNNRLCMVTVTEERKLPNPHDTSY